MTIQFTPRHSINQTAAAHTARAASASGSADAQKTWFTLLVSALVMMAMLLMSAGPAAATAAVNAAAHAAVRGAPDSFADLAEKLSPAVVNIQSTQTVERQRRRVPGVPDWPFRFREREDEEEREPETRQASSVGSGFLISADGLVVTNNHVVENADEITVVMADGSEYEATVKGLDPRTDLAVLKIERDAPFPFVQWGDSDAERVGDWVLAIGNPFGLGISVTAGIVSARGRTADAQNDVDFIQTDASINRGNSGGPLFNMEGQVIGVNTAIFSPTGGNVGIGFSIPSNDATYIVGELRRKGRVIRGWLGVQIQPYTRDLAEAEGREEGGAMVSDVLADTPAAKAGIQIGDVIKTWDGQDVEDSRDLIRKVGRTPVGKEVKVTVLRGSKSMTLTLVVVEREEAAADAPENEAAQQPKKPFGDRFEVEGMDLGSLTDAMRQRFNIPDGVDGVAILNVRRNSNARERGLRPGFVILRISNKPVSKPADVVAAVEAARKLGRDKLSMQILGAGAAKYFVVLELSDED